MAIDSDLDLMLRVSRGDTESFEVLLQRYRMPVVGYCARLVRDPTLAEDLAQEVFLRVYQARQRYLPSAKFTTWLYRIATNLALNAIRDRKGEPVPFGSAASAGPGADQNASDFEPTENRIPDTRPTVEGQLMESDGDRLIRQAVEMLPEKQRAAVILHKYQDVDYRQIAKILRVSESAVKSLLFRAYETLRLRLEPAMKEGLICRT
ncbi:MAG TPA: sigma-70 family RNA polymerase sigma factor [Terriglobia bacterium]|nr:sigma-70 family RNA polymerase sigma factor [Terriglobia bacterium]